MRARVLACALCSRRGGRVLVCARLAAQIQSGELPVVEAVVSQVHRLAEGARE
jgi:hypothetical protein